MRRRLCALALSSAVAASASAAGAAPQAKVKTLAYANGPLLAVAQDGDHVTWMSSRLCTGQVRIRSLSKHFQKFVGVADPGGRCEYLMRSELVVGGDRAIWTHFETGNESYTYASSAALSAPKVRAVTDVIWDMSQYGIGRHLGGLAAEGKLFVYSTIDVSAHGPTDCDLNGTCIPYIAGGNVFRFNGTTSVKVPHGPASALLAAFGTRLADVPAGVAGPKPKPKANGPVEVRNAITGQQGAMFSPAGTVRAIALSANIVSVLVSRAGAKRIERRSVATGALVGSTAVPPTTANSISMDANWIVFRVGKAIRAIAVGSGAQKTVATAKATPVGVSVDNGRVVWGETLELKGKPAGRIQALQL